MNEFENQHPRGDGGKWVEKTVHEAHGGLEVLPAPEFDPEGAREVAVDMLIERAQHAVDAVKRGDDHLVQFYAGSSSVLRTLADRLDAEEREALIDDYAERLIVAYAVPDGDQHGPDEGCFGQGRRNGFSEALCVLSLRPGDDADDIPDRALVCRAVAGLGGDVKALRRAARGEGQTAVLDAAA